MTLNYKQFGSGFPLIILHGLLGSLDNWQSIAKKIAEQGFSVYIIDQRNHGRSPHTEEFDYNLLSSDLLEFMEQHHIQKAHLLGHSMGGKTVMQFALTHPQKVQQTDSGRILCLRLLTTGTATFSKPCLPPTHQRQLQERRFRRCCAKSWVTKQQCSF